MKILGITGGVGAGKSTVLDYLQNKYQARVIQADQVGHMVQEPGQTCYKKIVEMFGSEILNEDFTINRQKLGAVVFSDPAALQKLNHIVHPSVKEYIIREIQLEKEKGIVPFVVLEAALLLEDHYDLICDQIWYIYADEETRAERLKRTRGYSDEKVIGIMKNQMNDAEFREKCDVVIDNSNQLLERVYEQIDQALIHHTYI